MLEWVEPLPESLRLNEIAVHCLIAILPISLSTANLLKTNSATSARVMIACAVPLFSTTAIWEGREKLSNKWSLRSLNPQWQRHSGYCSGSPNRRSHRHSRAEEKGTSADIRQLEGFKKSQAGASGSRNSSSGRSWGNIQLRSRGVRIRWDVELWGEQEKSALAVTRYRPYHRTSISLRFWEKER